MFGTSRALLERLDRLTAAIDPLVNRDPERAEMVAQIDALASLRERVDALELARAVWEADVEGLFLKAQNQYKATAASEARARTLKKNETLSPPDDPGDPAQYEEALDQYFLSRGNDETGSEEGVQPMRVDVEASPKNRRKQMKFS